MRREVLLLGLALVLWCQEAAAQLPPGQGSQMEAKLESLGNLVLFGAAGLLLLGVLGLFGVVSGTRNAGRRMIADGTGRGGRQLWIAYVLWALAGTLGIHRIYLGFMGSGFAMMGFGFGLVGLALAGWAQLLSGLVSLNAELMLTGGIVTPLLAICGALYMGLWWLLDAALIPGMVAGANAIEALGDVEDAL